MIALMVGLVAVMPATSAVEAKPSSLKDDALKAIRFEQKLDQQISSDLAFVDDHGKPVIIGQYFGQKPVILVLGYGDCPMLCSLVLDGLVESLQDIKLDAGEDFELVDVSIDPNETIETAADRKRVYLKRYGRRGAASGWHFLTGEERSIRQLAEEVGFQYAYDPAIDEYAHPSGFIVLTPEGRAARYFFGIQYPTAELNESLRKAGDNETGSPVEQFILLCFHYSPLKGKYGNLIMAVIRLCAVGTLVALAASMLVVNRRRKNRETASQHREERTAHADTAKEAER